MVIGSNQPPEETIMPSNSTSDLITVVCGTTFPPVATNTVEGCKPTLCNNSFTEIGSSDSTMWTLSVTVNSILIYLTLKRNGHQPTR